MGTIFFTKCVILISVPMNYNPSICQVEVARYGEFNFGQACRKIKAFLQENILIGHRSISLQSVCAKTNSFWTISVEHHSAQKLHSAAITLLQIFFRLVVAGC